MSTGNKKRKTERKEKGLEEWKEDLKEKLGRGRGKRAISMEKTCMIQFIKFVVNELKVSPELRKEGGGKIGGEERKEQEEIMALFALSLHLRGKQGGTIATYVSTVRSFYKRNVLKGGELGMTLFCTGRKGTQTKTGKLIKQLKIEEADKEKNRGEKRIGIELEDIRRMRPQSLMRCSLRELEVFTCQLLLFMGNFRSGEIVPVGRFDKNTHARTGDVIWEEGGMMRLLIGRRKADRAIESEANRAGKFFGRREREKRRLCVYRTMKTYLGRRYRGKEKDEVYRNDRLFPNISQSSLLREVRSKLVMECGWTKEKARKFGTHSYRIGFTTMLFRRRVPIEIIKRVGSWSSDAVNGYNRMKAIEDMNCIERMVGEGR